VDDDELGFLNAIMESPQDVVTHLVYSDWLEEQDDLPDALCLRAWVELIQARYDDDRFRPLTQLFQEFRKRLNVANPVWVNLVAKARDWITPDLADLAARLHLRTALGRKSDRQWINRVSHCKYHSAWEVSYWQHEPPSGEKQRYRWFGELKVISIQQISGAVLPSVGKRK
jgi:uncharacterized protein (TIGR02996 family)